MADQWTVLVFIGVCAAGSVATESRDRCKTMLLALRHPWDTYPSLDPLVRAAAADLPPPTSWRVKHFFVAFLQQCRAVMCIFVIACVPLFVIRDASDPTSLILNTLSALVSGALLDAERDWPCVCQLCCCCYRLLRAAADGCPHRSVWRAAVRVGSRRSAHCACADQGQ